MDNLETLEMQHPLGEEMPVTKKRPEDEELFPEGVPDSCSRYWYRLSEHEEKMLAYVNGFCDTDDSGDEGDKHEVQEDPYSVEPVGEGCINLDPCDSPELTPTELESDEEKEKVDPASSVKGMHDPELVPSSSVPAVKSPAPEVGELDGHQAFEVAVSCLYCVMHESNTWSVVSLAIALWFVQASSDAAPSDCKPWLNAAAALGAPEQKKRGRKPKVSKDVEAEPKRKPKGKPSVKPGAKGKAKTKKPEVEAEASAAPKARAKRVMACVDAVPKAAAKAKAKAKASAAKRQLTEQQKRINSVRSNAYHKARAEAKKRGKTDEESKEDGKAVTWYLQI